MAENATRLSPRQKMINLMYIVLTAMLALNVSSDVLDAFSQVEEGINRSNKYVEQRNFAIFKALKDYAEEDPERGAKWNEKAEEVRKASSELYQYIDSIKHLIVVQADGPDGDVSNIQGRDNLEAAAAVMLSPTTNRGELLRKKVEAYRAYMSKTVTDSVKRTNIVNVLSTDPVMRNGVSQSWEVSKFDHQPVIASITMLAKLQNDIKYAEGEALAYLVACTNNQVEINERISNSTFEINEVSAFVVPESRIVMKGGKYSAKIVAATIDPTLNPIVYVGGRQLKDGLYEFSCNTTGVFDYSGYINVPRTDGGTERLEFKSSYTVIEPAATVSATMMNVLYAGIDNPISISVPGMPMSQINATMTNGSLTRNGDIWIAKPTTVGSEAVITVTATVNGNSQTVNTTSFRVRKLPDPTPYIAFGHDKYLGGKPLAKGSLLKAPGVGAAIDDGLLDIQFTVLSFETVFFDQMGNAMPEISNGSNFSERQKAQMKSLSRGKRFYISRIKAKGPDGITRDLSPIEVIVN